MSDGRKDVSTTAGAKDGDTAVDAFVREVGHLPSTRAGTSRGRLLFAMDATASREPTWDHACSLQGEMFVAADSLGGLDVRLAFYRGFDEFKVSRWTSDGRELARLMGSVRCLAGRRAAPLEDIGGIWGYAALLDALAEKAAGTRKRLPSEFAGLGKFDPEEFDLDSFNHDLALLGEIVAEEDAYLAQIQAQAARQPRPSAAPFDIHAMLSAMAANMAKPPRGSKPKRLNP